MVTLCHCFVWKASWFVLQSSQYNGPPRCKIGLSHWLVNIGRHLEHMITCFFFYVFCIWLSRDKRKKQAHVFLGLQKKCLIISWELISLTWNNQWFVYIYKQFSLFFSSLEWCEDHFRQGHFSAHFSSAQSNRLLVRNPIHLSLVFSGALWGWGHAQIKDGLTTASEKVTALQRLCRGPWPCVYWL